MNSKTKGFTLVELLLVVAILALLVAIVMVAADEVSKKAKEKSMYASLKSLKVALETYYIQQSVFPPDRDDGDWDQTQPALLKWAVDQPRTINSIPKDIFLDGQPRVDYDLYDTAGQKPTYIAWSYGPDKTDNITGAVQDGFSTAGPGVVFTEDDIFVTNAYDKVYEK